MSHTENGFSGSGADADSADVLVISGSFPPGTPDQLLPALIRIGREAGAVVIVDTSGPSLLRAADAGASVLKPNEHELRDATGLDDPIDGARELLRRGAELVLLSLGAEGMLAVSPASVAVADAGGSASHTASGATTRRSDADGSGRPDRPPTPDASASASLSARDAPARAGSSTPDWSPNSSSTAPAAADASTPAVNILHARLATPLAGNPTGAGDAAVAACAVLMDAGIRDPEQILRRATAWSAAAVLMPLAGEIHASWPDLERALLVTSPSAETFVPARDMTSVVQSHAESEVSTATKTPTDPKESR